MELKYSQNNISKYFSVPRLGIDGPLEVFTQSGSSVQLECTLVHGPGETITWYETNIKTW